MEEGTEKKQEIKLSDLHSAYKDMMLAEYQIDEKLKEVRKKKNDIAEMIFQVASQMQNHLGAISKAFPEIDLETHSKALAGG